MLEAHRQRRAPLRETLHRDLRRGTDRPRCVLEPHQLREVAERANLHLHQPVEQLPGLALALPVRLRVDRGVHFLVVILRAHPLDRSFQPPDQPLAGFVTIALDVRDPLRHRRGLPKGSQANSRRLRSRLTADGLQIVGESRERAHPMVVASERRLKLFANLAQLPVAIHHQRCQPRRYAPELLDPARSPSSLSAPRLQLGPLGARLRLGGDHPLPSLPKRVVTSGDRLIARRNRAVNVVRVITEQALPERAAAPRPAAAVPAGGSAHDGANARPRVGRTRTAVPRLAKARRAQARVLPLWRWAPIPSASRPSDSSFAAGHPPTAPPWRRSGASVTSGAPSGRTSPSTRTSGATCSTGNSSTGSATDSACGPRRSAPRAKSSDGSVPRTQRSSPSSPTRLRSDGRCARRSGAAASPPRAPPPRSTSPSRTSRPTPSSASSTPPTSARSRSLPASACGAPGMFCTPSLARTFASTRCRAGHGAPAPAAEPPPRAPPAGSGREARARTRAGRNPDSPSAPSRRSPRPRRSPEAIRTPA